MQPLPVATLRDQVYLEHLHGSILIMQNCEIIAGASLQQRPMALAKDTGIPAM